MKKHLKIFSATTFQIICNQLFGLLFFLLLSCDVSKDIFGDLNWSIAVSVTASVIFTFGFDYIVVRKISSGGNQHEVAGTYLAHTLAVTTVCVLALLVTSIVFPAFFQFHDLFFCISISTLLTFVAAPFKQLAMGKEKFWNLAIMNVSCNFIRVSGLLLMIVTKSLSAFNIKMLFIGSSGIELLVCNFLTYRYMGGALWPVFKSNLYKSLVKESLPQTGTVLLDSAFARMDWILMGLLSTKIFTADYSFAYKAFESSRIPLLIIAPVLLPKLSRIYSKEEHFNQDIGKQLNALWKVESIIWAFIPMMLNVCWVDLVNLFTHNKYGESTQWVYLVLSMGIPMLFINNYLWTIAFAKGRLSLTFRISIVVTLSNFILNIILIPYFHALGAAIASTLGILVQLIMYSLSVKEERLSIPMFDFIKTFLFICIVIAAFHFIQLNWLVKGVLAMGIFGGWAYGLQLQKYVRPGGS